MTSGPVRQRLAASRIALILLDVQRLPLALRPSQRTRFLDWIPRDCIVPESKPKELIEDRSRVVRTRERHCPLGAQKPLDAARGDLTQREVFELRPHPKSEIVAIVLLRPVRQFAQLQILKPQVSEVSERTT